MRAAAASNEAESSAAPGGWLARHRLLLLALASLLAICAIATVVAPRDVLHAFERFTLRGIALTLAAVLASTSLAMLRFRVALAEQGHRPPMGMLLTAFATGQVSNSFLFNVIGQSLSRGAVLATAGVPFGASVLATYVERLIATVMLLALAMAAAMILFLELRPEFTLQANQLLLSACGIVCVLAALRWRVPESFLGVDLAGALGEAARHWRVMLLAGAGHGAMLLAYAALLGDLKPGIVSIEVVAALAIVMFAASLPISFAGWGLRELSSAHALAVVGVPPGDAVAVAIAIGLVSTAMLIALAAIATVGGSMLLRRRRVAAVQDVAAGPDLVTRQVWRMCVLGAAALVFFQVRVPIASGELTVNLGDLFALTGAALALYLGRRERTFGRSAIFPVLMLLTAAIAYGFLRGWFAFGSNHWALTNRGIGWIFILAYALLGASAAQAEPQFRALAARVLVVAAAAVAVAQLLLFCVAVFGVRPADYGFFVPLRGFAQNANAYAVQTIVAMIAALTLAAARPGSAKPLLVVGLFAAAIFLTSSRTGYIMLALLALALLARRAEGDLPAIAAIVLGIAATLAVPYVLRLLMAILGGDGFGAGPEIRFAHASSDSERWQTLLDGLEMWRAHPWLGAGLGGYVQSRADAQLEFQVIHSVPVWLLAEFGIVGTALAALGFLKLFLIAWRIACAPDAAERAWGLAAIALLSAIGAAFLVHDFFYQRIFWLALGLTLGVATAYPRARRAADLVAPSGADERLLPAQSAGAAPRVSVVIPYFNAHATLPETLQSLEAQRFRDFEIVIVDDGSSDPASRALLETLGSAVRIHRQPNRGLPAARNAGVLAARGALVLPLDADDLLDPRALERLVATLDGEPAADLAFSWARRFGDESGVSPMAFNPFEQLFVNEAPYCMLMRRELVLRAGGYDETMRLGYEDWEFNIRLGAMGARAVVVPEPLFEYRIRQGSMLRATTIRRHVEIWREIRLRHPRLYSAMGLVDAWRRGRRTRAIWPLPMLALWGGVLAVCPPALINPAYRSVLLLTRTTRDRWKAKRQRTA